MIRRLGRQLRDKGEATGVGKGLLACLVLWLTALGVWMGAYHWEAILRAIVWVPDVVYVLAILALILYLLAVALGAKEVDDTP